MNNPIIVFAPQGAGKTLHADFLMSKFNCTRLVDPWDGVTALEPGDLALTNTTVPVPEGCRCLSLDAALYNHPPFPRPTDAQ